MAKQKPQLRYSTSPFYGTDKDHIKEFEMKFQDARSYFINTIKPRLDFSYKIYIAYAGDRQQKIQDWQSNVSIPYAQSVIETLMPRILDARPDISVKGRNPDDQLRANKQQHLLDYNWEISKADEELEDHVRTSLIYGTSFLQVGWRRDIRELLFLSSKQSKKGKPKWEKRKKTFYDAPVMEWTDPYSLWYDWHNVKRADKEDWFRRRLLSLEDIERKYPGADPKRLEYVEYSGQGDLTDYSSVRQTTKVSGGKAVKGYAKLNSVAENRYQSSSLNGTKMYEVIEWWRPFVDEFSVLVGASRIPILYDGKHPIPFDFKEAPFLETTYLKIPGEFEGIGLPMILQSTQLMLNLIKNQRLDAAILSIHKMWIVNPMANVNKDDLVTRPFGIIYSPDPNGVREIQFGDIKESGYREEELLKNDMRHASGVDDLSMGTGGAGSATEAKHLRESTLERVRLFINHLGSTLSMVVRWWMSLNSQFYSTDQTIRITGKDGLDNFVLIQPDDTLGEFDYVATVNPSISGQLEVKKKQGMDLITLLQQMPFIDMKKLVGIAMSDWGIAMESITPDAEPVQEEVPPEISDQGPTPQSPEDMVVGGGQGIPGDVQKRVYDLLGAQDSPQAPQGQNSPSLSQMVQSMPQASPQANTGGSLNAGGALNTNGGVGDKAVHSNPEAQIMSSINNLQTKK